jgi:hypothetical protein
MGRIVTTIPRPSRITVPVRANPLAKLVFGEMQRQSVTYFELEMRSGVLTSTFKAWRTDNAPGLASIEAALGSLGWCLVPVPRMDRIPARIKEGLDALNADWAREEPLLHQLLASACLAPILVEGAQPVTIDVAPTRVTVRRKAKEPNPYQVSLSV